MATYFQLGALFLLLATQTLAQTPTAPAINPKNLTAVLEKAGQYTTFIKLLISTQVSNQIAIQLNSSKDGMTVFAPTDNAFQNLKPGTLNGLTQQEQVQLIQYHVIPKFYTLDNFQTVSNPVRTQAGDFGLTIISSGSNQVNVSSGLVETRVNNALSQVFPLAVYQIDQVLLPKEMFGTATPPVSSPADKAKGPAADGSKADGPVTDNKKNGGDGLRSMGMGVALGVGFVTMGFLS